jgi:quercetin dioxygenase-like cupin family protein
MKIASCFGVAALALACQTTVFAREAPTPVQASVVLKTESSWDGKSIVYPEGKAQVTGLIVEVAPGAETGWHTHPVASFAYILEGELEVRLKNGATKQLKAGDALAEVVNTLHNGRNLGLTPVKLIVFYIGAVGQALTVTEHAK